MYGHSSSLLAINYMPFCYLYYKWWE
jgi:hypothetical protein